MQKELQKEQLPVAQKFLTGKQRLLPEGLTLEKPNFAVVTLLQREKRKLGNRVMSLVKSQRLIKQSVKLSMTGKMMSGPLKLKDALRLRMTYRLETQCTIYSAVQIFGLVKVIQRKSLRHTTAGKETVFFEIVEHIESHSDEQFDIETLGKMMEEKLSSNNVLYLI